MALLTDSIKPIYLGYEEATKTYYFYFIKEGVPRFLIYVTYFYWGKGPQTALSLVPVPEEVEAELGQFLLGNLRYEFVKVRKNSKRESVQKVYRLPQQVDGGLVDAIPGNAEVDGSGNLGLPVAGISTGKKRKDLPGIPVVIRKRRTKAEMLAAQDLKKSPIKSVMEVSTTKPIVVSNEVSSAKRRRKKSQS